MRKEIYNEDKYKSQIQKYALCCDDFNDGVYRKPREKATLKKYMGQLRGIWLDCLNQMRSYKIQ